MDVLISMPDSNETDKAKREKEITKYGKIKRQNGDPAKPEDSTYHEPTNHHQILDRKISRRFCIRRGLFIWQVSKCCKRCIFCMLSCLFDNRHKADYRPLVQFDSEQVKEIIEKSQAFVAEMEQLLSQ